MSNRSSARSLRTGFAKVSESEMRASEPLAGTLSGRLPIVTTSSCSIGREEGATMRTWWPRATNCSRRCVQWLFTPPGTVQSYGETSAIFTASPARGSS